MSKRPTSQPGDLIISGYAVHWWGEDRQGETFIPGSLDRSIERFNSTTELLPIRFNHRPHTALGHVLSLKADNTGVWATARISGSIKNDPELGTYYRQIQNGTLANFSVGAVFKRVGNNIVDTDLRELSVTAIPIDKRPAFKVENRFANELEFRRLSKQVDEMVNPEIALFQARMRLARERALEAM